MRDTTLWKIVLIRLGIMLVIAAVAGQFFQYLGNFPHKSILQATDLPQWLYSWGNFDGVNYINIADRGYRQFEQAFFPLYPSLIALLGSVPGISLFWAGFVISNISFAAALYVGYKLLSKHISTKQTRWYIALVLLFPTAFYFTALYTESLFVFLTLLAVHLYDEKRYNHGFVIALLSGLVRIQGVFLVVILAALLYRQSKSITWQRVVLAAAPIFGLGMYMTYLWSTTGDPLYFLTSQPAFGANRSDSLILLPQVYFRYLKIFYTADINFQYYIAFFESIVATVALLLTTVHAYHAWLKKSLMEGSIVVYSYAHVILPTLTGTFSSVPRYALLVPSIYIALVAYMPKRFRIPTAVIFGILQIVLTSYFVQGYFVS